MDPSPAGPGTHIPAASLCLHPAGKALLNAIVVKAAASRLAARATPKCVVEVTRRPIGIGGGKVRRGQRAANAHWIPFSLGETQSGGFDRLRADIRGVQEGGQMGILEPEGRAMANDEC